MCWSGYVTLETHKLLKEERKLLSGNARTCILYTETHGRKRSWLRGLNSNRRLCGHILEDIAEQILQHVIQGLRVRPHQDLLGHLQTDRIGLNILRIKMGQHLLHDPAHRNTLTVSEGKRSGESDGIQRPIDQTDQFFIAH